MQVLYVNLVTACTLGIMLAAEPPEPSVMDRPPRRPGKRLLVSTCFSKSSCWNVLGLSTFGLQLKAGPGCNPGTNGAHTSSLMHGCCRHMPDTHVVKPCFVAIDTCVH